MAVADHKTMCIEKRTIGTKPNLISDGEKSLAHAIPEEHLANGAGGKK